MCGIAGLIDSGGRPEQSLLARMAAPLVKRGPDDEGFLRGEGVALVHRRLSIIDLEGGHQPILNEDESLAIVCNGEIYGFCELRKRLENRGHSFRTHSDNEVILHLYEEHGPDCVRQLNGMFAFAILHVRERRLFLARDRFGQKPLFYAQSGGRFAFASGPASLAVVPWVDTGLDPSAIHDFLEYQYVPEPRSIYRGVSKFPPHSWGMWENGRLRIESYWEPAVSSGFIGCREAAREALAESLRASVRRRLVADVPVGLFLSGGLDSSLVCSLAAEVATETVQTFSIGFPERKYDEREFAAAAARHIGTDHHFLEVRPDDFDRLERIVRDTEEPFGDSSILPTSLLSEFTRRHVTVALSGDGADELFGGYDRYRVMHLARLYAAVPAALRCGIRKSLLAVLPPKTEERTALGRLRRLVELSDLAGVRQYLRLISKLPDECRDGLYGEALAPAPADSARPRVLDAAVREGRVDVDAIMELDLSTYLNNDILVKVDRASMAHALEVRSPFLDPSVAELALSLPHQWKLDGRRGKRILREALGDRLPPQVVSRTKMGFGVPVARWFRDEWRQQTRELLLEGRSVEQGLFRRDGLNRILQTHSERKADYSGLLFCLLVLEIWLQSRSG